MGSKAFDNVKQYIIEHNWKELTFEGLRNICFQCDIVDERTAKTYIDAMIAQGFVIWDRTEKPYNEDVYVIPFNRDKKVMNDPEKQEA